MGWISIISAALQIINMVMDWALKQGYIQQGRDEAITEQARELFRKTSHGRKVTEEVNAMSIEEVDAALVALEPNSPTPDPTASRPKPVQ